MIAISEKKFKNRQTLLKAALYEFNMHNYETASLNEIIKKSATSKGSFYYHFKNKEDLYIQLLAMSLEAKWHYINGCILEHKEDFLEMDIFDKFLYQAEVGVAFGEEYPEYNRLGQMFLKEKGTEIYNKAIEQLNVITEDIIPTMIEEAYALGQLDTSYSKAFIISVVTHLFNVFNDIFNETSDKEEYLRNLKDYVRFMRSGLS